MAGCRLGPTRPASAASCSGVPCPSRSPSAKACAPCRRDIYSASPLGEWLQPSAWIAIDDETTFWTVDERRAHLVATDGCEGLLEPSVQDRLMTLLVGNFGAPTLHSP